VVERGNEGVRFAAPQKPTHVKGLGVGIIKTREAVTPMIYLTT
jgi:hypothetical protein